MRQIRVLVRNNILDVTMEILRKDTINNISLSQIAEKAGISRMTVYRYFKDKYDIVHAIFERDCQAGIAEYQESKDYVSMMVICARSILNNRDVYHNIFCDVTQQNSFLEKWEKQSWDIVLSIIDESVIDKEFEIAMYYHIHGSFYVSWACVLGEFDMDMADFMRLFAKNMPSILKTTLNITD